MHCNINPINYMKAIPDPYWVYMVRCSDGSFYTGISNNVASRINDHNSGRGAKYTRNRGPVELIYQEKKIDKSAALKREYEIKQLRKIDKGRLAKSYADASGSQYVGSRSRRSNGSGN